MALAFVKAAFHYSVTFGIYSKLDRMMLTKKNQKTAMKLKVLMMPWLAHGHISAFFELAKRLSTRNFHVYICSTPVNLSSLEKKLAGKKHSDSIELVEFHLPSSPELPPHFHTTNGLPPHLMVPLQKAYKSASPQFSGILSSLRPDLVIYDYIQAWAPEIASNFGIPAVQFLPGSATFCSFVGGLRDGFPEIYLRDYEVARTQGHGDVDLRDVFTARKLSSEILLLKTCREIEGKYIDLFSTISHKKTVPVGHLVQDSDSDESSRDEDKEIMEWMDEKEKGSIVYVSFGSEYFLTKEEIAAISKGLELSNVNFIWVIRFPNSGEDNEKPSIEEALPEGFVGRVGNRGKIVEGWAPQAKILKHSGTGAFVSHCGWNSILESVKWGIPIVAVPMHIDQPLNARLVEAVGVGVEVVRDDGGNLQSGVIAGVIRKVLEEKSGEVVRMKAKNLSETLEKKGDEEIDLLRDEIIRLCSKA